MKEAGGRRQEAGDRRQEMDEHAAREEYGPPIWPPFERLEAVLERWAREYPEVMAVEVVGRSVQGRALYVVQLTDPDADDEGKEHVLITALHAGVERNATTTIFYMMEWFLSGDPVAREILRRQVIVCMPVPNPDAYVEGVHGNVYGGWTLEGPVNPDGKPEAVAVKQVMDRYQPEVHADIHGLSMEFERYIMLENSASSYSNLAARSYHREIVRMMDEAALAEGYPSDLQESDAERIFWGPELEEMGGKLWPGRPRIYGAIYCYNLYHTLLSTSEVCWERSGLLRHRRLFQVGNEVWPSEYYPGYPCRVIMSNYYHMITAYGQTAAARRRSRVELWNRQGQMTHGMTDPFVEGKTLYLCATSSKAARTWLGDRTVKGFVARLREHPDVDLEPVERFVAGWPAGQNHPEAFLSLQGGGAEVEPAARIEHGLSLRLRIFYSKAQITDLRVNGHPIPPSETDGYLTWVVRGYTYVQINIPPEKLGTDDLFVVTCAYDPGEKRTHWRGWCEEKERQL